MPVSVTRDCVVDKVTYFTHILTDELSLRADRRLVRYAVTRVTTETTDEFEFGWNPGDEIQDGLL